MDNRWCDVTLDICLHVDLLTCLVVLVPQTLLTSLLFLPFHA